MKANIDGIAYPRAAGSAANAAGVAVGAKPEQTAGAAKSAGLAANAAAESTFGAARPAETAGAADGASGAAKHEITREEAIDWLMAELKKGEESKGRYTVDEVRRHLEVKRFESLRNRGSAK